jgi:hypothetical protein
MGRVYGHIFRAGLLEVEDARTYRHTSALTFSGRKNSWRTVPP